MNIFAKKNIKTILILFVALILIATCFFVFKKVKNYYDNKPKTLPNGTVVYDFSTQRQQNASKILYEYILSDMNNLSLYNYKHIDFTKNPEIAKSKFDIDINNVYAIYFDLNDDGEKEIIGFVDAFLYGGVIKNQIFILQKNKNAYINIVKYPKYFWSNKIIISSQKTNDYRNVILEIKDEIINRNINLNYHNKFYYSPDEYKELKEIIDNDSFFKDKKSHNIIKEEKISANKILYKYVLDEDLKMNEKEAYNFTKLTYESVTATEIDLNNDGKNEILGIIRAGYYWGRLYPILIILEEKNNNYVKISKYDDISVADDIYLNQNKKTGYYDIIAFRYDKPVILKYHKKCYIYKENTPCYY